MGTTVRGETIAHGSIAGGFVRVDVAELAHAWRSCRARPLGVGDFRAWLAAREMLARRRGAGTGRSPIFGVAELATLLDVAQRTAAASVRRLVAAGLLIWSESAIAFPPPPDRGHVDDALADSIAGGHGPLAIPRRLLRWLARGARPALIATALAALLRCVSRRRSGFGTRGRFKASWVANSFGIAPRHAKDARAQLVALGWLTPLPGHQWAMNRWGRAYRVRLDWRPPRTDRHPLPADPGARSSPPDLHPEPLREEEHPEPARGGPAGASLAGNEPDSPGATSGPSPGRSPGEPASSPPPPPDLTPSGPLPRPNLRDVRAEDLADTGRALELHRQAVERGMVSASEADRVRFVAAVEHARVVGRQNPPGLLARIVAKGWWHLVTHGDEDRATRRLREHDRPASVAPPRNCRPGLSSPAPGLVIRSPYGAERPVRESSALANVLARLAGNAESRGSA